MSFTERGPQPQESMEEFKLRVEQITGVPFDEIPQGESNDALNHKLAVRGNIYVVGYGEPKIDTETGEEVYSDFRVVDLNN